MEKDPAHSTNTLLTLRSPGQTVTVPHEEGATILEALAGEPTVSIAAPCGGRARCGKCAVRVLAPRPAPEPSPADRRFLSDDELARGLRLACTCNAGLVTELEAPREYRDASIKGELPSFKEPASTSPEIAGRGAFAAAIDIGTTTVAAFLVESATGEAVDVLARMNRQSVYGADVLSRIAYAEEHGLDSVAGAIRAQLDAMLGELADRNGAGRGDIGTVVIAGNTTMLHFVAAEDVSGIGRAPFMPIFIEARTYPAAELELHVAPGGRALLLPSVSAYVGADIVAAAVAAELDRSPETTLLVDIGTNGELALRHGDALWACSTAAGPAFEGASISAGVGGISGAIRNWERRESTFRFETIGGAEAVGVCGSGLLDLMATLLSDAAVDETGRMVGPGELDEVIDPRAYESRIVADTGGEPAFEMAGPYRFTQKDVREVQLAKAAIAAGIDTLLEQAEISAMDLDRVVLTGGFGHHLRISSAVRVGLLPDLDLRRFEPISNGAGTGALMVLRDRQVSDRMSRLQSEIRYIELSGHPFFQDAYIDHMTFPEREAISGKRDYQGG